MVKIINGFENISINDSISQNFGKVLSETKTTKKKRRSTKKEKNDLLQDQILVNGGNVTEKFNLEASVEVSAIMSAPFVALDAHSDDNTMSYNEFDDYEKNYALRDHDSELKLINKISNTTAPKGASALVICGRNNEGLPLFVQLVKCEE